MTIKEEALQLIDRLPAECSWEDVMYEIYVRKTIEAGMADSDTDRVVTTDEVRHRLGLQR